MNPTLRETLRRNWRLMGAITAFVLFTVIHFAFFRPAAERYRAALASVGGIESVFNPGGDRPLMPPRVFALVADQSLGAQDALERGNSGALGVVLLEDLGRIAGRSDLRVTASEPGQVTQEPLGVQVRAHMTLRGRYPDLVAFFDELTRSSSLFLVDRFTISAEADGSDELELWATRLYLKKAPAAR